MKFLFLIAFLPLVGRLSRQFDDEEAHLDSDEFEDEETPPNFEETEDEEALPDFEDNEEQTEAEPETESDGTCTPDTEDVYNSDHCQDTAENLYCDIADMRKTCCKTCRVFEAATDPECRDTGRGCVSNKEQMCDKWNRNRCKLTCGLCTPGA